MKNLNHKIQTKINNKVSTLKMRITEEFNKCIIILVKVSWSSANLSVTSKTIRMLLLVIDLSRIRIS